jgi:triosephosphate isomerase (TIM)
MEMRKKIVAGNWKMNKSYNDGLVLCYEILDKVAEPKATVVFCTPFIHLYAVNEVLKNREGFFLGAQNCHQEDKGAYTGETSLEMLQSVGVDYVILGHSERREYFGESDALLAQKTNKVLSGGLTPIFCCGESLDIRDAGSHVAHVNAQIEAGLFHLSAEEMEKVVIAYEPIWAIGTGRTASPAQAQEMHAAIRSLIAGKYGADLANSISILYGGSVNAANAKELFSQPDVDGGLVGGASLKADEFATIINSF